MIRIEPEHWYALTELRLMGLDGSALEEAIDAGQLRSRDVGPLTLLKGEWVRAWLEDHRPEAAPS